MVQGNNIDYEKRNLYCMMCMDELDEQEENYCENPRCFYGQGQFGKMCGSCVEYDEHCYAREAENFYRDELSISHCGQTECEEYLEDKLILIEDGEVCLNCDCVYLPDNFTDYPFDNDEGLVYRKRCNGCYEELQDACDTYWEMLRESVFVEKVHKRIKDFWKDYIPDDKDNNEWN